MGFEAVIDFKKISMCRENHDSDQKNITVWNSFLAAFTGLALVDEHTSNPVPDDRATARVIAF